MAAVTTVSPASAAGYCPLAAVRCFHAVLRGKPEIDAREITVSTNRAYISVNGMNQCH